MLKRSPDAVGPPCCSLPYHEALPSKPRCCGTTTICDRGGAVVAQPATRLMSSAQRFLPQLMPRHSFAERRARLLAVTLAEDVAQIGYMLKRVGVLGRVAVVG